MTENTNINCELYKQIGEPLYKWARGYHFVASELELETILLHNLIWQFRNQLDRQLKNQWKKTLI